MNQNLKDEMNVNFVDNIFMEPVVNGTKDGLSIKNNVKVDTKFSFSLMVTTYGNVVQQQDFNIAWYVNKPPTFVEKPLPIIINADYDNIQDGTEDNVFVYESPVAVDDEGNKILMEFSGFEGTPC